MKKKIKWGILGCGKIANKFASDLKLVDDAELFAVASRDLNRGEAFKTQHGVPRLYTNYQEFVNDGELEVVYVATPHGFHYEHVKLCLDHHKAVLCEKAFALNYQQASEMINVARANKVFLMEAFWTRFIPQYQKVLEIIDEGTLGKIKLIQADFGFKASEPVPQRLYDPILGGGALLDIGIYPVFLAQSLLGEPVEIQSMISAYPSGVDEQSLINLKFANGALATLCCTFAADTPVEAMIAGTEGRLHLRNRFHNAIGTIELIKGSEKAKSLKVKKEKGYGYQFEARHVNECLQRGLTESPVWKFSDTLALMTTLDKIRQVTSMRYPVDAPAVA
jgi:predicted dehydrogenase